MQGSSGIQQKITILIIPSHGDFFSVLSLLFQGNGNNFLFSVSLEASFSRSLVKCGAVVFFCLLLLCWKPFDLQSRVLLTDWCFHTVTLAESSVFRGPRCHSGTNALEFSQIIPLCACLCVVHRWSLGKMESIYLSVCQSVWLLFTNRSLYWRGRRDGGGVTFDVSSMKGDIEEYR